MNDIAEDQLAALKQAAEDPMIAPSRRVRARKALKLIAEREQKGAGQMRRSDIIDLIVTTEGSAE